MPNRFYISTAIPYVNAAPHVGHGLEATQVDALARFHRLIGDETYFLTGSDDNSITNVLAAEREGLAVPDLVARNTRAFMELDEKLDISYDQFIRTSIDPRHAAGAQKLWTAVDRAGDIYVKDYFGLYCPRCELFYDEDELVDGLCPDHLIAPDKVQETNYFFRLSRYGERLTELIASDTYRVIPEQRKNEVLSFLRSGLRDISISRTRERARGWGVPVPGDETQMMYVWFDALSNYITALGYAGDEDLYRRFWVENDCRVHAVGKGIIRFHAVYWPAMLLSAGVPLPHVLFVHGHYTVDGRKMSKSLGNSLSPVELVDEYGSEAVRYYFLAATHPTADADFSIEAFEARYNADLANDLGNLLNRTISMIRSYRGGRVPSGATTNEADAELRARAEGLAGRVHQAMVAYQFQHATAAVWEVISAANRYIEQQAPWKQRGLERGEGAETAGARDRLDAVLNTLAHVLRLVAVNLRPFLPVTAERMFNQLGIPNPGRGPAAFEVEGAQVTAPEPLFPRLEREAGVAVQP